MRKLICTFMLTIGSLPSPLPAKVIYTGDEVETLTLAHGGATLLRFPSPVKTISQASRFSIVPADETQPNYALLSVTPRLSQGEDRITFFLSDGSLIQTKLVVVPKAIPEKTDSFYDLKKKESLIEKQDAKDQTGAHVSELELMKAMIRGDQVAGYQIKKLVRTVNIGVKGIECRLVRLYSGPKFNGYVFKIENETKDKDFVIDLTRVTLGSPSAALLSQIDGERIEALGTAEKNETFLRIVAKGTSLYSNVKLPFTEIKRES